MSTKTEKNNSKYSKLYRKTKDIHKIFTLPKITKKDFIVNTYCSSSWGLEKGVPRESGMLLRSWYPGMPLSINSAKSWPSVPIS